MANDRKLDEEVVLASNSDENGLVSERDSDDSDRSDTFAVGVFDTTQLDWIDYYAKVFVAKATATCSFLENPFNRIFSRFAT